MPESDALREVRERVHARYFPAWSAVKPSELADPDWSFLTEGVAHWFLVALDEGVIDVVSGLPTLPDGRHTWLFERAGSRAALYREGFLEVAAAGLLALRFGWRPELLTFQSPARGGRGLWAFDLLAYADQGRSTVQIAGEAKWRQREAERLIRVLETCGRRGEHVETDCRELNAHRKYVGLLELAPRLLWIICPAAFAPSTGFVFAVHAVEGGVVQLRPAAPSELVAPNV